MSDDTERQKTKAELENFGWLVDRYAQSKVLPLLIPLAILILNAFLLLYSKKLAKLASLIIFHPQISMCLYIAVRLGIVVWVILSSIFVGKILARYGECFYKKEGTIELETERVPAWVWIAFEVTFIGSAFMSIDILPVRWALTIALTSFGTFMLYICKKKKAKAIGVVYGSLGLAAAVLTALGVLIPLPAEDRGDSFFVTLMIYIISAGFITVIVVHIYNRLILRKIKRARLFGEQEKNSAGLEQH